MKTEIKSFNIVVNEISIKNNHLPVGTFKLAPKIQRKIGKIDDGNNNYCVEIQVDIHNTPEVPFPMELTVNVSGIFNIEGDNAEQIDRFLKTQGFQMVFPHVRSLIANATASAMVPAVFLPIVYADKFIDVPVGNNK